jgi:hypothetical protein
MEIKLFIQFSQLSLVHLYPPEAPYRKFSSERSSILEVRILRDQVLQFFVGLLRV